MSRKSKKFKKREALKRIMNEVWNTGKHQISTALVKVVDSTTNGGPSVPPSTPVVYKYKRECSHNGTTPIKIGGFDVHLAGTMDGLDPHIVEACDYIISLNGNIPILPFGSFFPFVDCTMRDMGGVPDEWETVINKIRTWIYSGKKIIAYCSGSHGRTGCFGASLIALMEPNVEDPIAEIRKRHCKKAVETVAQARAIFALKGMELPEKYKEEWKPVVYAASNQAYQGQHSLGYPIVNTGYPVSSQIPSKKNTGTTSKLVDGKTVSDNLDEHEDWCCCAPCVNRVVGDLKCIGYENYCSCTVCCKEYKLYLYNLEHPEKQLKIPVVEKVTAIQVCKNTDVDIEKCLCNDCLDLYFDKKAKRDHTHPIGCNCNDCVDFEYEEAKHIATAMSSSIN